MKSRPSRGQVSLPPEGNRDEPAGSAKNLLVSFALLQFYANTLNGDFFKTRSSTQRACWLTRHDPTEPTSRFFPRPWVLGFSTLCVGRSSGIMRRTATERTGSRGEPRDRQKNVSCALGNEVSEEKPRCQALNLMPIYFRRGRSAIPRLQTGSFL